ncbi:TPA: hypothetical protein ACIAPS_004148 [Salmonella enterica subsp. enterica serovar Bovismorbificans]
MAVSIAAAPGFLCSLRYLDEDIRKEKEALIAAQASLKSLNDTLSQDKAALSGAMESRKQKEKKAKDAENKLNEEKNKPRKGAKYYGHDYHPAPKTEDIKGLAYSGENEHSFWRVNTNSGGENTAG